MDILIKNARLKDDPRLHNIYIRDGKVISIKSNEKTAEEIIDAEGKLVTESYYIAHLHLDKVNTFELINENTLLTYQEGKRNEEAIKLASEVKKKLSEQQIYENARKTIDQAIHYGVTGIRAFADVDEIQKLRGISALIRLKHEMREKIDLQVVAFPQEGLATSRSTYDMIEKSVEIGADVIGGIPWIENRIEKKKEHIRKLLELAKKKNKDVAMLVDDICNANSKTIEMLAHETIRYNMIGRIQACHLRSMQYYDNKYLTKVLKLCRAAGISFVLNPHTGPCNPPLSKILRYGIKTALGQDDCNDAYYPFGRCKMIEVVFLASHILRLMRPADIGIFYDMVTVNPRTMMGMNNRGIYPGKLASLVLLPTRSIFEAVWFQLEPELVVNKDKITVLSSRNTLK